jgi:DNA-binding NtrC family response regulator
MNDNKLRKVLIVDDDEFWVKRYKTWVEHLINNNKLTGYYNIEDASDGEQALKLIKQDAHIRLVISDVVMQPNSSRLDGPYPKNPNKPFGGIWLAMEIKSYLGQLKALGETRDICCILISDKKDVNVYFKKWIPPEWESEGFVKYIDKEDVSLLKDGLLGTTYEAIVELEQVTKMNMVTMAPGIIGKSDAMVKIFQEINLVASQDVTILIQGESGTGKELFARLIHALSKRKGKPYVAVNCGALTSTLVESEIFGYEKGAFTGAISRRKGKFEHADGGTVFLDEVGDMTNELQVKLLRVLQERQFERVGGNETIKVDVRVIAATNKDLNKMMTEKTFRKDLYYRLNVVPINSPPLRERKEDLGMLIDYFLKKFEEKFNYPLTISEHIRQQMLAYDWPGNVRELSNIIERAVVLKDEQKIKEAIGGQEMINYRDLSEMNIPQEGINLSPIMDDIKKKYIMAALKRTKGNITEAAKILGVRPRNLTRWCKNYNLHNYIEKCEMEK